MLFRTFLSTSQFPDHWTFAESDWFVDRTGLDDTDDLGELIESQGRDSTFADIKQSLVDGLPPPGKLGALVLFDQLVTRWDRLRAGSLDSNRQILQLQGRAHGSLPVDPPALGSSVQTSPQLAGSGTSIPASLHDGTRKRPASLVGPQADLTFSAVRGDRARKMIQAAQNPEVVASAVSDIRDRLYAIRTWASHRSEVKLYVNFCASIRVAAFPITLQILEAFVGMMVRFEYCARSIPQYVSAIFRQMTLMFFEISSVLRSYRSRLIGAAKRGSGDSHRVLPITREMILGMRLLPAFVVGPVQQFFFRITVVTWYFLLRADESIGSTRNSGLAASSFNFDHEHRQVTITLGVRKEDSEGLLCRRTLECCCDRSKPQSRMEQVLPFCPYCASCLLANESSEKDPELPLRPSHCTRTPQYSELLAFLRAALKSLGFSMVDSQGEQNYGTHSLRRGGAQALVLAGWSLEAIRFFGRWLSDAIDLYLLQTPSKSFGQDVARSMAGFPVLRGSEPFRPSARGVPSVRVLSRPNLQAGISLNLFAPDLVPSPPAEAHLEDFESDVADLTPGQASQGMIQASLVCVLPEFPSAQDIAKLTSDPEVIFHSSISDSFPVDFQVPSKRSGSDRCVVLFFSDSLPLVVVNLRVVPHMIIKGR